MKLKQLSIKFNFWVLILAFFIAGTSGTLILYRSVSDYQKKIAQADFKDVASDALSSLQNVIHTDLTALWALQSFFAATPEVSREEFEAFTRQLLRLHPDVDSYHWIPRVPETQRAVLENETGREIGSPFHIWDMNRDGHLMPTVPSEEYFPSLYVEPIRKNAFMVGLNQFSIAERRRCMLKASDSKSMIATRIHPLRHLASDKKDAAFFVFLPVYEKNKPSETLKHRRENLKGYVAVAFRVDSFIQAAFTTTNMSEMNLEFYAETVDAKNSPIHQYQMYASSGFKASPPEYTYRETLKIADQTWVAIAKSTELFRTSAEAGAWELLLAGFSFTLLLCVFPLVWEQRRRQGYFLRLSLKDELTQLYNRRGFFTLAQTQLKLSRRKKMDALLIFADLDGLKKINDVYGHEEGDKALAAAAAILRKTFRESDLIARIGGDEFAVIAFDTTIHDKEVILRHLYENTEAYQQSCKLPYKILLSAGAALIPAQTGVSLEKILSEADKAMYGDKKAHKVTIDFSPN